MRLIWAVVLPIVMLESAYAGDDASGPVSFRLDLSHQFTKYSMTVEDKMWSTSLAARFIFKGRAVHFVRTTLPLNVGDKTIPGVVYQAPALNYEVLGVEYLPNGVLWASKQHAQ